MATKQGKDPGRPAVLYLHVAARVKDLLDARGFEVSVVQKPGWSEPARREELLRTMLSDAAKERSAGLVLDISAAGPEMAVRSVDLARETWPAPFLIASFDGGRGTARFSREPRLPSGAGDEYVEVDAGNPADLPPGMEPVGPGDRSRGPSRWSPTPSRRTSRPGTSTRRRGATATAGRRSGARPCRARRRRGRRAGVRSLRRRGRTGRSATSSLAPSTRSR